MAKLPIPFGNPATYPGHSGVDYPAARGTLFRASGPGVMGARTSNSRSGITAWVDYDGYPGVAYSHLDNYNHTPAKGTRVVEGDIIGAVGMSGNTTGPHLHSEVNGHSTTAGYWRFFDPNRVVQGGGVVEGNQRVAGPNGCKARTQPSTAQPPVDDKFLAPGAKGTFDGWIRGESVEGNNVWFRGAYSQLFFWSGGFTDKGTHDLVDLNPPSLLPYQRQAGPNGAFQRAQPASGAAEVGFLKPGTIGDFNGWINGEPVQGQPVWFRGMHSGAFSWAGGFTDQGTHDLADLNPPAPEPADPTRTVGASPANVRPAPYTSSAATSVSPGGTVETMDAHTRGQAVEGNDVWFRRAAASGGGFMWSGGFTSQSIEGLPFVTPPPPEPEPEPGNPLNPLNLPTYPPVYPGAVIGLEAPLGFYDCVIGGVRASRKTKGSPPVPTSGVISLFIIHWAWPRGDDQRFFSTCNSGGSCPTTYTNAQAQTSEFIRPGAKPAATGAEWNWRSWAWEVEPITDVDDINVPSVTDEQIDEGIEQMVFLREHHGKMLDGAMVDFLLDEDHVIADRDTRQTVCPGAYLYAQIPRMIAEAQRRYDERHPVPVPDAVEIPRADAEEALAAAEYIAATMKAALE